VKRWRHWCVTDERFVLALTLADVGYLGLAALWYLDVATGRRRQATSVRRRMDLATFAGPRLGIAFLDEPGGTRLRARARGLRADLLAAPGGEHLSVRVREVVTNKHVARPTAGTLVASGRALAVDGAFAALDASAGVWPFATSWCWAVAHGMQGGRRVGVNLGARWTDGSGATENALYVDGRVRPLAGDVRFHARDGGWAVTGQDVDLVLEPRHERVIRARPLAATTMAFGRWRGAVAGVRLDGLLGWAEDVSLRW
jgi:hypothetical protein